MKRSVQLSEVQQKQKLLSERLAGHQGLPLGIAMVLEGVHQLSQLRMSQASIRELVEKGIVVYGKAKVVMPSQDEVAKVLGEVHDSKNEK